MVSNREVRRSGTALLALFMLIFSVSFAGFATGAWAGYRNLGEVPDKTKALIQQTMTYLVTKQGFTPEAAAGVAGNINQESEFKPAMIERNKGYFKPILDSNPCKLSRAEGQGAVGYFQLDGSRRTDMFCWIHKQGKPWTDLDSQIQYALVEDIKVEDPFKIGDYMKRTTSWSYCSAAEIDCKGIPNTKMPGGINDFKKMKNPEQAAVVWAAVWERCSNKAAGNLPLRASMAKEIFAKYGGSIGTPAGGADTSDADKAATVQGAPDGKPVSEDELTGMSKEYKFKGGQLPETATKEGLSTTEQYDLQGIADNIAASQEYGPVRYAQVGIVMLGMLFIMWGILLMAAGMFDRTNVVFEFSLVGVLSLGRLEYVAEKKDSGHGKVTFSQLLVRSTCAAFFGLILVSGSLFGWMSELLMFLHDQGVM